MERTTFLPGRYGLDVSDEVTAFGVVRVIEHPPHTVNGVHVREWVEVRVVAVR